MPITCCMIRLTPVIPIQQQRPIRIGFPPVLINLIILEFRPIAAMARMIKNLLSSFNGKKTFIDTPMFTAIVVITDAAIK